MVVTQNTAGPGPALTPDEVQEMVNGIAGRCRECKRWETGKCAILGQSKLYLRNASRGTPPPAICVCSIEYRIETAPDFGCIRWQAREAT